MNFLHNLDYLLYCNGMTRSDLARAIDVSPSTINTWYNRSCDGAALKTLVKIAEYFNVSLDLLINEPHIEQVYRVEKVVMPPSLQADSEKLTSDDVARLKRLLAYMELAGKGEK